MKHFIFILAFLGLLCDAQGQSCDVDGVFHSTFEDVKIILDDNDCNSCHADQMSLGGWNYDSYSSFLSNGDCDTKMILHGDAANSYFYRKLGGGLDACGESNNDAHVLTPEEFNQIESWINFGAPEYCVSVYTEVKDILDDNGCNSCHSSDAQAWRYDSYSVMTGNGLDENCSEANVIVKRNSNASLLYDKINNDGFVACGDPMHSESGPMSDYDVALIRDWINSGANETSSSLPVILTNFSVNNILNENRLTWSTESEIGTEKFVIERSPTGTKFEALSEVATTGNASLGAEYSIVDDRPLVGDNYYRLKIVDFDGSYNYSNIGLARVKSDETTITVYPNPAISRERITVKWLPRVDEESTYLNIVDVNGQNLHRKIIFEGTNYVRLPELLDGVYYVIVEDLFGSFLLERVVIIN